MSRHSNRSFSFTNDKHTRSSSSHMESDVATMQREIDAYTRKLELEKKYIAFVHNWKILCLIISNENFIFVVDLNKKRRLYSISHMLNQ